MVIYSIAMLNSQRVSTGWMKRMTERDPWNWMLPQHVQRPGCLCCDVPSCQGKHYWHLRKIHPGPKGLASQFDHHDSRVPFFGDNFLRRLLVSKARDLGDLGLPPKHLGVKTQCRRIASPALQPFFPRGVRRILALHLATLWVVFNLKFHLQNDCQSIVKLCSSLWWYTVMMAYPFCTYSTI